MDTSDTRLAMTASRYFVALRANRATRQLEREGSPPPGLRLPEAKLSRKSNQVARGRIRRFESDMPSHAVVSNSRSLRLGEYVYAMCGVRKNTSELLRRTRQHRRKAQEAVSITLTALCQSPAH